MITIKEARPEHVQPIVELWKALMEIHKDNQADIKIYFVEYENQAGWRNKEKMHLMY